MSQKRTFHGNARFLELGSLGAPFRSLINIDHITNVRFEQKIGNDEAKYDDDGQMTAPPAQFLEGWQLVIVLAHGAGGQNIMFPTEEAAVGCYNTILDMIVGVGVPMSRMKKLTVTPEEKLIEGMDGKPLGEMSDDEKEALASYDDDQLHDALPGEDDVPPLTDKELDQLANPEIDIDVIADAVEAGLGADEKPVDEPTN